MKLKKKKPYITKNKINLLDKLRKEIDAIKQKDDAKVEDMIEVKKNKNGGES